MPMLYGPLSDCPSCKQPRAYGRCIIGAKGLMFRCKHCAHSKCETLPPVTKKIIYIDQFALSKMVKQKDDPFWAALHERLVDLASKNLITCPYSPIHEEESLLSVELRSSLKAMYREIAGDDEFKRPGEIEKAQLARLLKQFLGKPEPEDEPRWMDWAKRDPHHWSDLFHIHVDFDINEEFVRDLRADKERFRNVMEEQCEDWRQNPQSFDQDVERNYASWRTTLPNSRLHLTRWLAQSVVALNENERDPIGVLTSFFDSNEWKKAPFAVLWVRLWAKIAEMARSPRGGRKPQLGDYFDAQVLPYYAPYCNAMFIDRGFRAIACDPKVDVEGRFGTQCFTEKNGDEFLAYLEGIDRAMTDEHKNALRFIHSLDLVA